MEEVVVFVVGIVLGFFGARSRSPNCEGRLASFFSLRSHTRANTLKFFKLNSDKGMTRVNFGIQCILNEDNLIVCPHRVFRSILIPLLNFAAIPFAPSSSSHRNPKRRRRETIKSSKSLVELWNCFILPCNIFDEMRARSSSGRVLPQLRLHIHSGRTFHHFLSQTLHHGRPPGL